MGRLVTVGWEATPTIGTGIEGLNGQISAGVFEPEISTTVKRSGNKSGRITNLTKSGTSGRRLGWGYSYSNGAQTPIHWHRVFFRIDTLPAAQTTIWAALNANGGITGTQMMWITLDQLGKLRLFDEDGQIGTESAAISLTTWHKLEAYYNRAAASPVTVEARINETTFASAANRNWSAGVRGFLVGGNLRADDNAGGDFYFDDYALNDQNGSFQNSWPTDGNTVLLLPDVTIQNDFTITGGLSAHATVGTYPDDVTKYLSSNTVGAIAEFGVTTPSELTSDAVITLVHFLDIHKGTVTADTSAKFAPTIRASVGGTQEVGSFIEPAAITRKIGGRGANDSKPIMTLYDLPGASTTAWTKAALDAGTMGVVISGAETNPVDIISLGLIVEYIPGAGATPVGTDFLAMFSVRALVRDNFSLAHSIRQTVNDSFTIQYSLHDFVGMSRDLLYNLRAATKIARDIVFAVRAPISVSREIIASVRETTRLTRELLFNNTIPVLLQRMLSFSLRENVSTNREIAWGTRTVSRVTKQIVFSVRDLVPLAREIGFDIAQLIVPGTVRLQQVLSWSVRKTANVNKTVSWADRVPIPFARTISWNNLIQSRLARVIQFSTRETVRTSKTVQWANRVPVQFLRDISWHVLSGVRRTNVIQFSTRAIVRTSKIIQWTNRVPAQLSRTIQYALRDKIGFAGDVVWSQKVPVRLSKYVFWKFIGAAGPKILRTIQASSEQQGFIYGVISAPRVIFGRITRRP